MMVILAIRCEHDRPIDVECELCGSLDGEMMRGDRPIDWPQVERIQKAEGLGELRRLAAKRDKKRDIAALTLNMASSAAGGNVGWTVPAASQEG